MANLNSVIDSINQQIDAVELAKLTQYHTDKFQHGGTQLKCFCPIHNELAFRSLIFNLKAHTFKCMMKRCEAFEGGSLVQFWAIFRKKEPIEAALELAEKLHLSIDKDSLVKLADSYIEQAEAALAGGDAAKARAAVDEALGLQPRNAELRLLSARVWDMAGAAADALSDRLTVLDAWMNEKKNTQARELMDKLLTEHAADSAVLERNIALTRQEGQSKKLVQALLQRADVMEQKGDCEQSLAALREAHELVTDDATLLRRMTGLCERLGRRDELSKYLALLTDLLEGLGETAELLKTLEERIRLEPENLELMTQRARVLENEGLADQARKQFLAILEAQMNGGMFDKAEALLEQLLKRDPQDVDLLEEQALLWQRSGQPGQAVETWRHLAALARTVGLPERVAAYFEKARAINPNHPDLRLDVANWKLESGDLDGGLNDLFTLAGHFLELHEVAPGKQLLDRIVKLAPTDLEKRMRVGRCLERSNLEDDAFRCYVELAKDLGRQQQFDAAQAICEEARRLRPLDPTTLELRIETHLAMRQEAEAIEACREVARALIGKGELEGAEETLRRAVGIDETETNARIDLARLCEKSGKTSTAVDLWIEMAHLHRNAREHAECNMAVREALRLDPRNVEARVTLADGLETEGKIAEALEVWKDLGRERAEKSADAQALAWLSHALDLAPRDRQLTADVAKLTLALEGADTAYPYYSRWLAAIDAAPDNSDETAAALEAYEEAVRVYPDEIGWRLRLAGLQMEGGDAEQAAEQYEALLQSYSRQEGYELQRHGLLEKLVGLKPARLDLKGQLARSMMQLGREHDGVALYREVADQHQAQGDFETALALYDEALQVVPDNTQILRLCAELNENVGNTAESLELWQRLAEVNRRSTDRSLNIPVLEKLLMLRPDHDALRAELAEIYEADGDIDRSIEHRFALATACKGEKKHAGVMVGLCLKIRSMAPDFIPARELLVEGWLAQKDIAQAKQELDALGDLSLTAGDVDGAEKHFRRIREIDPEDIGSGERLGKLYEASGKPDEAAEAFKQVLSIYEKMSETARAIGVLQKLKQLHPDDLDVRARLARALLAAGQDRREAGEEWLSLIELAMKLGDKKALAKIRAEAEPLYTMDWAWRTRLAVLVHKPKSPKESLEAWRGIGRDALAAKVFDVAREAASEGLRLDVDDVEFREMRIDANRNLSSFEAAADDLRLLAERFAAEGEPKKAAGYLGAALELKPRSLDLMDMLAEMEMAAGETERARQILKALVDLHRQEGRLEPAIARGRKIAELAEGDIEARDFLAALLSEAGRTADAIEIWRELAEHQAAEGNTEAALFRFSRVLELLPGNIDILRRIADLTYDAGGMAAAMAHYDRLIDALHAQGDAAATIAEYRRILELEPGHLRLKERLAEFLNEQGNVEAAKEALLEIAATYRDERDQANDAIRLLRRVQSLDPDGLEAREQEAVLLENMGRTEEAAAAWRKIAQTHRRLNDLESCAGCLVHCAELELDKPQSQIDVADIFAIAGDSARATEYYLRAIDTFDRQDNLEPCVDVLERAIAINPDRFDLADALGRIFERLGRMDRAAAQWMKLGQAYEDASQWDDACRTYRHLCSLAPEDMDARTRLAEVLEQTNERGAALKEWRELARLARAHLEHENEAGFLRRALQLEPNDEAGLKALANALGTLGRADERFDAMARLERIYFSAGRLDEALESLEQLKALRPEDPELMARAIELLIKTGKADVAAQRGIELIQVYFDQNDDQHALEMVSRIAEIDPHNIDRRISLARLVHTNGREPAAFQEFFLLATKLFGENKFEECLRVCNAGLERFGDDVRLRDLLGRTLLKLGREAEAIEVQLHLAAIYDERGEEAKAQRVYESILEDRPNDLATLEAMVDWAQRHDRYALAVDTLVRLAESHYVAGALDRAIDAMERIQTIDPNRLELKARLAEIYLEKGDEDGACNTWLATARGMTIAGRHDAAVEIYEKTLKLRPDSIEIIVALTEAYAAAGRDEDHRKQALILGERLVAAGETIRARDLLIDLTRRYQAEPAGWERLAAIHRALNDVDAAVKAYRRLCEIHRAARRLNEAKQSLASALEIAPDDAELIESQGDLHLSLGLRAEGVTLLTQAARSLQERGEHIKTRDLCHRILKIEPSNLAVRRLLATSLERAGQLDEALEEYRQAARSCADAHENADAIEILSHLLALDPGRLDERELYAKLLKRENKIDESINQYLLLLEKLSADEDPRRAIKYCRQILDDNPDQPQAHMHLCGIYQRTEKWRQAFKECEWLADYYQSKGATLQAEEHIRQALGWLPEELSMRTRLVELLIAEERTAEATVELEQVARHAEARADAKLTLWAMSKACDIQPNDLEPQRRLADYLERQGDLAAARAARMKLIRLLLAQGKMDEARQLAERIVDAVIEDDALRLEIAGMFEEADLPEVAAFHYHHLARRALAAENLEDAKKYAQKTIDLKPRHVGGRETLIQTLLAQRENAQAMDEYEKLFELYDEASEWDGALRTLQAMVDLAPSRPAPRKKLITLYRKMNREEPMIDQIRRLVEIYVNAGDCENAVDCLRDLMSIRPEDTRARTRYIDLYTQLGDERELMDDYLQLARILGRKGQVVEAMRTYEKLLHLHPDEPVCREEFVQFLFEQGQVSRGIDETRLLAVLYDKLGNLKDAGRVLDRALNYSPDEFDMREQLAAIYLKTNRRGLALETYRALSRHFEQTGQDEKLTHVMEQIVQIDPLNVELRQRLAEIYYRLGRQDDGCAQSMALAQQYVDRELWDLAEYEYRRVLETRPDDTIVWQKLVDSHMQIGSVKEIVPDIISLADRYRANGKLKDAIGMFKRVLECEPENIDVLQKYIDIYMQIGLEQDLVDDYIRLADLKMKAGDVADANRIYKHLMDLAPGNKVIYERLTQTQTLLAQKRGGERRKSGTDSKGPDAFSAPDDPSNTRKLIRNYENVLRLNQKNPTAHAKLAELLDKVGDIPRAEQESVTAAEQFLEKGDVMHAIDLCQRHLVRHPGDARVKEILTRAMVQRDSLNAIDKVISQHD